MAATTKRSFIFLLRWVIFAVSVLVSILVSALALSSLLQPTSTQGQDPLLTSTITNVASKDPSKLRNLKVITKDSGPELEVEANLVLESGCGRCSRKTEQQAELKIDPSYTLPPSTTKAIRDHFSFLAETEVGRALKKDAIHWEDSVLIHQIFHKKCKQAIQIWGYCSTGETGFALAGSAVTILDAHIKVQEQAVAGGTKQELRSLHFAVDPFQQVHYKNVGARGVARYLKHHPQNTSNDIPGVGFFLLNETAAFAMSSFTKSRTCFDIFFLDDGHRFEQNIIELSIAMDLMDVGGIILMHDTWMASIKATRSWVETNLKDSLRIIDQDVSSNLMVLLKVAPDVRAWDHFEEF